MSELLVTMTRADLEKLVLKAVAQAATQPREPEVMSLKQAAEFFDVHPRTVMAKLVRERGCPVHWIGPQDPRFRRSECLEWLSNQPKESSNGGS